MITVVKKCYESGSMGAGSLRQQIDAANGLITVVKMDVSSGKHRTGREMACFNGANGLITVVKKAPTATARPGKRADPTMLQWGHATSDNLVVKQSRDEPEQLWAIQGRDMVLQ